MQDKRSPLQILQTIYGYQNFRGQQEEIINHIIEGENAFVLMPTGSGKSLCYQIPSLCMDGVGIIISPLIALMHDQVSALNQLGIKAVAINSGKRNCIEQYYIRPLHVLTQTSTIHIYL